VIDLIEPSPFFKWSCFWKKKRSKYEMGVLKKIGGADSDWFSLLNIQIETV